MKLPDFFLAGAPKCGTTALYNYLKGHPSIFMPRQKEINFFSEDLAGFRFRPPDLQSYAELYSTVPPNVLCGDASSTCLYSKMAISNIMNLNPEAKIVAILRNPCSAVRSLHAHQLYTMQEDATNLRDAWALQEQRRRGENLPLRCHEPKMLLYREIYSYPEQIKRLLTHVPEPNRLVLIFEEFARDTRTVYASVLRFLGVDQQHGLDFRKFNERRTHRFASAYAFFRYPPFPLNYLRQPAKRIGNALGLQPLKLFEKINSKPMEYPPLAPDFEDELERAFADEITQLENLMCRSLGIWRRRENGGTSGPDAGHLYMSS